MARKKEQGRRRRSRGLFGRFTHEFQGFELEPETRKNIAALLVFLLGILGILSLFHAAGAVGEWLRPWIFSVFGIGAFVVPFLAVCVSVMRLDPERFPFSFSRYIGLFAVLFGALGLLHMTASQADALMLVDEGRGGGYIGLFLSHFLRQWMGSIAATILLVVVFCIGLMMLTNYTLGDILSSLRSWRERLRENGTEETEMEEEEPRPEEGEFQEEDAEENSALPIFSTRALDSVNSKAVKASEGNAATPRAASLPPYKKPDLQLLSNATARPTSGDVRGMQETIQRTLETFGIEVAMGDVNVGPTVTQYTLKPEEGVKLAKITALHNDLALALSAHPIRIEAPIPGKALVGIEVPNRAVAIVRLREILESDGFRRSAGLGIALGKDVTGEAVVADIAKMPHLLIAGATGSGKSVMINNLVMSLLFRHGPAALRLLLIDPKRVELTLYNGIPHLATPVVTEPEKAINALRWAVGEMDRRYTLLSEARKRDIASYNAGRRGSDILPYLVVIIDELADLMARNGREVESAIVRLAQMARAVGIHLVVATQRPSVDVITGLIKANITCRIAFNVASLVDSRTILDGSGAEKLLGNGDMLFLKGDISKPRRIQASYVSEEEVKKVVSFLSEQGSAEYNDAIIAPQKSLGSTPSGDGIGDEGVDDALLEEAERIVTEAGKASTSLLQRRLRIGYSRAARIIDMLEERGVVGPQDGSRPREVLTSAPGESGERETFSSSSPSSPEPLYEETGDGYDDEEEFSSS